MYYQIHDHNSFAKHLEASGVELHNYTAKGLALSTNEEHAPPNKCFAMPPDA